MVQNAYIHIPFCLRKCNYCSFVSFDSVDLKDEYINILCSQIQSDYKGERLDTIYFGGGTPSLLSVQNFKKVLKVLNYDDKTEITVEINPETVDKSYLKNLYDLGINRLSIGVQAFDDKLLKSIGRGHSVQQACATIYNAKNAGFKNISIDLIYGLPGQSLNDFKDSLSKIKNFNVEHISLYGLKIEEGSKFYNELPDNLPDNDEQADMYLLAVDYLKKIGFKHYEVSNFAKNDFESKHNLNYWNNNNYYGFGCAASGYEGNTRYSNIKSLKKYIKNPAQKDEIIVTSQQKLEEAVFLGFRKTQGIDIECINQEYSIDFNKRYKNIIDKYLSSGHLKITDKGYALTINGILLSNDILSEFIED